MKKQYILSVCECNNLQAIYNYAYSTPILVQIQYEVAVADLEYLVLE